MEERIGIKNSPEIARGRKIEFRGDQTMLILGIPLVVVLEPIHVDIEAIGVHVHVGNEELCNAPSAPLSF